jgi:hypothetical protein
MSGQAGAECFDVVVAAPRSRCRPLPRGGIHGSIFAELQSRLLDSEADNMKLVPKKTRKAVRKSLRKIIKQHGPELAAAMAGGALGNKVSDSIASGGKKSRKLSRSEAKAEKGQGQEQAGSASGSARAGTVKTTPGAVAASVRNVLRGSKDATLGFAARAWLNSKLRGIAEMTELSIDTKRQTCRAQLQLAGEPEPTEIYVRKYTLRRKGDRTRLTVIDATASRQWIAVLLREFVTGQTFPVPTQAATALKLLT